LADYFNQIGLDADFDVYVKYIVAAHPVEGAELTMRRVNEMKAAEAQKMMEILANGMTPEQVAKFYLIAAEAGGFEKYGELLAKISNPEQRKKLIALLQESEEKSQEN
jgi:hypothetical protein